jgi:hypothetical protein
MIESSPYIVDVKYLYPFDPFSEAFNFLLFLLVVYFVTFNVGRTLEQESKQPITLGIISRFFF